jgi:hypothetical protein
MTITALPQPPSRQSPSDFDDKGDAFLGALPTFVTEANALAIEVNNNAVLASSKANEASAAAAQAVAVAGASVWVSGTTYSIGAAVYSPIDLKTYRRKTNGTGTTDPSLDSTNWALVAGTGDVTLAGVQTLTNKTFTGYTETVYDLVGTVISPSNGSIQTKTLSANTTFTETLSSGQSVILGITAGSYSVTWPVTLWAKVGGSGTAPALTSSGVNWIVLWKVGSTLRGAFLGTA